MRIWEILTPFVLGAILILLGISNTRGNIQSLHWYHRWRVSEVDRKPFGKLVGNGTIIIGAALVLFGVLNYFSNKSGEAIFLVVASVLLAISIIIGFGLSIYAMIKYNKGIF